MKKLNVQLVLAMASFFLLTTCKKDEPPTVSTIEVTEIQTSAPISGGIIKNDGGSQITERGVVWATSEKPTIKQHDGITIDGSGTGMFNSTLSGLKAETTYYVRAYATNSAGTGYGMAISFKTLEAFPPVLKTIPISDINPTFANSGGEILGDGYAEITERGIVWSKDANDLSIEINDCILIDDSGSDEFKIQITNLTPATLYFVRSYATNSAGTSYGNIKGFYTMHGRPLLTTIPVADITYESAVSGGRITSEGAAKVTARGVVWNLAYIFQDPTLEDNYTEEGTGAGEFSSLITELTSSQAYKVRAYAINDYGITYGETFRFRAKALHFPCPDEPTVTDSDGNIYNTVLIGDQCWMAENLKTTTYLDGTPIDNLDNDGYGWHHNTTGAYAWYDNDEKWKDSYGALYNWYAVDNVNGLCPAGWRVPTDSEWQQLEDYIVEYGFYRDPASALKSCRQEFSRMGGDCNTFTHPRWDAYPIYGYDAFGFSSLPAGQAYITSGWTLTFIKIGNSAYWWSTTEYNTVYVWTRRSFHARSNIERGRGDKRKGYSVRCIKD